MSGKPVIYWDACAFLCLLKGETSHGVEVLQALKSQAGAFDRGDILLATSVVGIAEVVAAHLGDGLQEQFEQMARRKNFVQVGVTDSIARDAARLRNHCYEKAKAEGAGEPYLLAMPDAIHVATAMRLGADVLVTLDVKNKELNLTRRELGMVKVAQYYPVPDLTPVSIQVPMLGLPGTGLIA